MSTSSSIPSARFWLGRRLLAEAAQNAHLITDNWLAELVRGLLELKSPRDYGVRYGHRFGFWPPDDDHTGGAP
jgi:hypothetical protein